MSNITSETIKKVAKLANIKIREDEEELLIDQLTKITNWVESLSEVDTNNVEILNNVHNVNLTLFPDEIEKTNDTQEILKNSPDVRYDYFAVPKVIEQSS